METLSELWEIGALIFGYLLIGILVARSMISIDRNLKARQAGRKGSNLLTRSGDYSIRPV